MQTALDQFVMALDITRLRAVKRRMRSFEVVNRRRALTRHESEVFSSLVSERASIVARLVRDHAGGGE